MEPKTLRFIEVEMAEVVAPDRLVDVLSTLMHARAILGFKILGGFVYVQTDPNKRFDLEMMSIELSNGTEVTFAKHRKSTDG